MNSFLSSFIDIIFPNLCIICGNKLAERENHLCLKCIINLPFTDHSTNDYDNELVRLFAGRFPFKKAVSFSYFVKGGSIQKIIHEIKYHHNSDLAIHIGYLAGKAFETTYIFDDIDYLVPIPLHTKRLKERGYNQAQLIAEGIKKVVNIPIDNNLIRVKYNISQTKNSKIGRWSNVDNLFALIDQELYKGKHILLIDDVITTGSTIESCIKTILKSNNTQVSIFSIALTI